MSITKFHLKPMRLRYKRLRSQSTPPGMRDADIWSDNWFTQPGAREKIQDRGDRETLMSERLDVPAAGRRQFLAGASASLGTWWLGGVAAAAQSAPSAGVERPTSTQTLRLGTLQSTDWEANDTNASIDRDSRGDTWMIIGGNRWSVYQGNNMDAMTLQHTFKNQFARPHRDDLYWASGLWIDPADGKWYCAVHCEFNYGRYTRGKLQGGWSPDHRRRMLLATSTDQGRSWALAGDILTGDNPEEPAHYGGDYYDKGPGDAQIYIDDHYFYAYYREGWYQKSTNRFYESVRCARCAKSERMAPGKWRKWYRGGWNEPGLGGHDTDVFNSNSADTAYVFFSSSLGKYVALIGAGDWENPEGYLAICTDLSAQDWTNPIRYADAATHKWYNWAVDNKTSSRHLIGGDSFRYYTSFDKPPVWYAASFVDAPAHPVVKAPLYPPDSVDDHNPGWDRR